MEPLFPPPCKSSLNHLLHCSPNSAQTMAAMENHNHQNDHLLPFKPFDLSRFVRKARAIQETVDGNTDADKHEAIGRWMEFTIAGINNSSGYRAQMNMAAHYIDEDWMTEHGLAIQRRHDFDSLLGRSHNLPYTVDLEVYPLFRSGFPITKSLHIPPMKFPSFEVCSLACNHFWYADLHPSRGELWKSIKSPML